MSSDVWKPEAAEEKTAFARLFKGDLCLHAPKCPHLIYLFQSDMLSLNPKGFLCSEAPYLLLYESLWGKKKLLYQLIFQGGLKHQRLTISCNPG